MIEQTTRAILVYPIGSDGVLTRKHRMRSVAYQKQAIAVPGWNRVAVE